MEGAELFPSKTDAEVEAELAQTTLQLEMLKATSTPGAAAASAAAPASAEDCTRFRHPTVAQATGSWWHPDRPPLYRWCASACT